MRPAAAAAAAAAAADKGLCVGQELCVDQGLCMGIRESPWMSSMLRGLGRGGVESLGTVRDYREKLGTVR